LHILWRTLLLAFFGFIVNNFPFFHLATARYYGVLPRIAICYLVVASLYLLSPAWKDKVIIAVLCLVGYWALMRFVPVPGFGVPAHGVAMNDHDGNLAAWLDRQIFSASHLYEHTRDPEGLLSTLPAIATTLFGLIAGMWLQTNRAIARKVLMLAIAGVLFICAGLAWNPFFPINKKLWTSSFSLFAGGWSLLLLAVAVYVVDVWRLGRTKLDSSATESGSSPALYQPLLVLGTNAILAYMIAELGESILRNVHTSAEANPKAAAFQAIHAKVPDPALSSLLYSLAFLLLCWLPVFQFYRRRIFLKI
jgi:predicted acyltransferase